MSKDIQGQESDEMIDQTKPLFDYVFMCLGNKLKGRKWLFEWKRSSNILATKWECLWLGNYGNGSVVGN